MADRQPILVVGAGPTGLALALWLARLGTPVRIVDKDDGPGETSRAMVVQARTLETYRQLGIAETVVARGRIVETVAVREAGVRKGGMAFGPLGAGLSPYPFVLAFPQDAHERVLLEALEAAGVSVERRTEVLGFDETGDGVEVRLRSPSGPETVTTPYLAGCDGAHSTVRERAGITLPGGTYAHRFFVADADVAGQSADDSLNICVTGEDFCLVFPLTTPGRARLIGIVPDEVAERGDIRFEDVAPSVSRNTALRVERVHWFSSYNVHHRVAERFRAGRAFLLGDAAHLHSPVGGQGMNTGLGDAANLAWKLAAVHAGRASPELLDTYELERMPFARRLVATTDRLFTLATQRGALGAIWRKGVLAHGAPALMRVPRLPRLAFGAISQTKITYRAGPLGDRTGSGAVRAGDRLPWVAAVNDGGGNFEGLRRLEWQVQVHGAVRPDLVAALEARKLPLSVYPWTAAAEDAGLRRDVAYVVRPDGYVGVVADADNPAAIDRFFVRWGLRPVSAPSP